MPEKPKTYFETELDRLYSENSLKPEQYQRIRQSKAFMETFYADKIELDDLTEAASLSRFHYIRMFQRIYGLTPRAYLRDLRISKAKHLLRTGLPITQVCFDVGYASPQTFSSVFKKCTGHTPKAYQDANNSNRE